MPLHSLGSSDEGGPEDEFGLFAAMPWKPSVEEAHHEHSFDPFGGSEPWKASLMADEQETTVQTVPGIVAAEVSKFTTVAEVLEEFHRRYGDLLDEEDLTAMVCDIEETHGYETQNLSDIAYELRLTRDLAEVLLGWSMQDLVGYSDDIRQRLTGKAPKGI